MKGHTSIGERVSFLQHLAIIVAARLEDHYPDRDPLITRHQRSADFYHDRKKPDDFHGYFNLTGRPSNVMIEGSFRSGELRITFTGHTVSGSDGVKRTINFRGRAGVNPQTESILLLMFDVTSDITEELAPR